MKEEGNSSAYAACNEPDITYKLEGEGEGNSSAYAACNESDITYFLEGEGGGQFVSPHSMQCI